MKKIGEIFEVVDQGDREVGIEIEMEGQRLPLVFDRIWTVTRDGSLRGESIEYVLKRPCRRDQVKSRLKILKDAFKKNRAILLPSDRCGVHIHINCQQLTFVETMNFALLFLTLEGLMVKWCGPEREGNMFCLQSTEAEILTVKLHEAWQYQDFRYIQDDQFRYAALNFTALGKYGSLEFRSMRTTKNMKDIETWISMLLRIFDASRGFDQPRDIVGALSNQGGRDFCDFIMGDYAELLQCPDMDELLMNNIRLVQDIAFAEIRKPRKRRPSLTSYPATAPGTAPRVEAGWQHIDFDEENRPRLNTVRRRGPPVQGSILREAELGREDPPPNEDRGAPPAGPFVHHNQRPARRPILRVPHTTPLRDYEFGVGVEEDVPERAEEAVERAEEAVEREVEREEEMEN